MSKTANIMAWGAIQPGGDEVTRLKLDLMLGRAVRHFNEVADVNLSPAPVFDQDGNVRLPGLDNYAMGAIFEELIHPFNEENNEEAGEHFTPYCISGFRADTWLSM